MAEWRPASTLKGLFQEVPAKPAGPPPLPTARPDAQSSPPLPVVELDITDAPTPTTADDAGPLPPRKPDFFDKARDLAKKAQARAERMQQQALANPNVAQAAIKRGAKAAVDYARSDEAKELARKTRDTVKGGALAASALVGAASVEGRERVRKAAEHPLGVGAALLCFFPLGLYLVWHHPHWTQTRKWAWTGAWLGVFFLMILPAMMMPRNFPAGYPAEESFGVRLSGGFLPTFDEQPSPVTESLSEGAEVWLLEDCDIKTGKQLPDYRSSLYVGFSGDELRYVVVKLYDPRIAKDLVKGPAKGDTRWVKYPAGESKSVQLVYTWAGRKHKGGDLDGGADEAMVLKTTEDFKSTSVSKSGSHPESSCGALIAIQRHGDEVRWELKATSSVSLVGGKGATLPPIVYIRSDSGSGRRLRSGE